MSNAVLPVLPGLKWDVGLSPQFNTSIKRSVSGMELRASFTAYPLWTFKLAYEVLRDDTVNNELKQLAGFFLSRRGAFDSFLYSNPADNSVTDFQFGIGNGTTTTFQLVRSYGGFTEPVQNVNTLTNIKKATVAQANPADYTISSTGLVTFSVAPGNGAVLTWTGTYYYRVRFLQDVADFSEFLKDLWELKKLEFVGATGNKV